MASVRALCLSAMRLYKDERRKVDGSHAVAVHMVFDTLNLHPVDTPWTRAPDPGTKSVSTFCLVLCGSTCFPARIRRP
jgi:hypothetical protein